MERWNPLSWWNDRAFLFRSGRAGLAVQVLNEGAKVSYEEMENRGKTSAENLRVG
jgi:hypothetical protein